MTSREAVTNTAPLPSKDWAKLAGDRRGPFVFTKDKFYMGRGGI